MNKNKTFKIIKLIIMLYVMGLVSTASILGNIWMGLGGVISGMLFMWLVKKSLQIKNQDERTNQVAGQAALMTYSVMTFSLALVSMIFIFWAGDAETMAAEGAYLKHLGIIFSYLTMLMIGLYAVLFKWYSRL